MTRLEKLVWTQEQLGEVITALARASGLTPQATAVMTPVSRPGQAEEQVSAWIDHLADHLGL